MRAFAASIECGNPTDTGGASGRLRAQALSDMVGFMTLTRHLKNSQSLVRKFIYSSAPELALAGTSGSLGNDVASLFGFDEMTRLPTVVPIPSEVTQRKAHAIVAGMALDYRLRMDLPGFDFTNTEARRGLDR